MQFKCRIAYAKVKAQLAQWIPKENAPPAPVVDLLDVDRVFR